MNEEVRYSIIVPLYNEELVVQETCNRLKNVMDSTGESYEMIFVDDGSRDGTLEIVRAICRRDERIKLPSFPLALYP